MAPERNAAAASKMSGEWIVTANILQIQRAVWGRIHFTENGELVYLALYVKDQCEIIGRGVGKWVSEGNVIGFQADIFQYESRTTSHVHSEPHRFRGIAKMPSTTEAAWTGEWYFCQYQQPPRVVGSFQATRQPTGQTDSSARRVEDMAYAEKRAVIAKLDKIPIVPALSDKKWKSHLISDKGVDQVYYVRNFLDGKQIEEMLKTIDRTCDWERMSTRDTQEFGSSTRCPCQRSLLRVDLPQWQGDMINVLHTLGAFHPVLYPANSVRLNAYQPGQGIHPHMDGPVYYPRAAIVTLGSQCVFDFYPKEDIDEETRGFTWDRDKEVPAAPELPPGTEPKLSLMLEPGSLLVFSGDAFTHHRHGIKDVEEDEITRQVHNAADIGLSVGDNLKRGRRVSLTIRHLLPRCTCSTIA